MKKLLFSIVLFLAFSSANAQCKLFKDYTDPFEKTRIQKTKPIAMFNMHKKITFSRAKYDDSNVIEVELFWDIVRETDSCFDDDIKLYVLDSEGNSTVLDAFYVGACSEVTVMGIVNKSQKIKFAISKEQLKQLDSINYKGCKVKSETTKSELLFAPITGPVSKKKIAKFFAQDLKCIDY